MSEGSRRETLQIQMSANPFDKLSQNSQPKFCSPLLDYGYREAVDEANNGKMSVKPLLLYLPGFDGSFLSPFLQFPALNEEFDVRCLTIPASDRSTYAKLKGLVVDYIRGKHHQSIETPDQGSESPSSGQEQNQKQNIFELPSFFGNSRNESPVGRPIYLAGESFGGILATDVALSLLEEDEVRLEGLTLINPATCFQRSRLAAYGPEVAAMSKWKYPVTGLGKLLPLFTDKFSVNQLLLILQAKALPSVINSPAREAYMGRVAFSLPFVLPSMPQETLDWRLREWLETGSSLVNMKLNAFKTFPQLPTLIIAGEEDMCLPSIDEAEKLSRILTTCNVHVVEGAGHASTCGSRVDMTALMRSAFGLSGPTKMSDVAAAGKDEYLGMEPRYDNATIGLSPLLYWSGEYYKRYRPNV